MSSGAEGLRVGEVLELSCLAEARLIAGAAGLDRIVQRLNVMEVPDVLPWVKAHELLLASGYPLRDDPGALLRLVPELDDRGLAALAIRLDDYLGELPPELIEAAELRGFPVILVPEQVAFDDLFNDVVGTLLQRRAAVAARNAQVHDALLGVVLAGGDLNDLANELTSILGGPVLVTTSDGRVLAEAGGESDIDRVLSSPAFDRFGRFRVESEGSGGRTHPHRAVVPVIAGRVDHGRIVAFSRTPIAPDDVQVLERAATVAALFITKGLAVAAVEGKYRADFLRDLLTGRMADMPSAVTHAGSLGWDIDRPMTVVVAELDPGQVPASMLGRDLRPAQERFGTAWQTVIRQRDPAAAVASFNVEVVVLLGAVAEADLPRLIAELDRQISGDRGGGRLSFSLGVSRVAAGPRDLPHAYEQARAAVTVGRRVQGTGARTTFDQLGPYRLLALIPASAEPQEYVTDVLRDLAADTPEAEDLRRTLDAFLETFGNIAETARRLHIHYNTLRHRIDRLERIVGPFTTDGALRLDLSLALRVREMRGT